MTRLRAAFIATAAILPFAAADGAGAQELSSFAILAGSEITDAGGVSVIRGNVGLAPGTNIEPLPGQVSNGTIFPASGAVAINAQTQLSIAFADLSTRTATGTTVGTELGSLVFGPGVYNYASAAELHGTVTLDGQGNPNAVFIFQMGSTLTTYSGAEVSVINGAQGANVYFVAGSSAVIGTTTAFVGNILADQSITLQTNATITCGGAWAQVALVSLDHNTITNDCAVITADVEDIIGDIGGDNVDEVAGALDSQASLPTPFDNLIDFLSPEQLAAALTQLAGEAGGGAAEAGAQSMDSFLTTVFDQTSPENAGPEDNGRSPATVKTLGYASEPSMPAGAVAALAPIDRPMRDPSRWDVWATGYGGGGTIDGDAGVASHDLSSDTLGFAAGFGRSVSPATRVGFALGAGGTNFGLSDDLGGGSSDMIQAAIYSRTNVNAAYLATALAYAYHSVSTERHVVLGPPVVVDDTYTASYAAHNVAAQIEAGYRLGGVTPYAALRAGAFFTPAYSENGSGDYGLAYEARTAWSLRSELGARVAFAIPLHESATLTVKARAAWAHDYLANEPVSTTFQEIPDAPFDVQGADPARDWLLLSAGGEIGFRNGLAIGGTFDTALATNAEIWSGTGRISYHW